MDAEQEWIARIVNLEKNLDIHDRKHRLKKYKQCFVGSAAIYVMINLKFATNSVEAVKFGNKLIELKIIKHVCGKHKFKNQDLFYEFIPGYNKPNKPMNIYGAMDLFKASKQISGLNIDADADEKSESEQNKVKQDHFALIAIDENDDVKTAQKAMKSVKSISKLCGSEHDALHLFDLILEGCLFYFPWNKHLINAKTQETLIKYIENHLHGRHNLDDFNLIYFQKLFNDKIKEYNVKKKAIFINIEEVSSLDPELMSYFFDVSQNDFKGKLFKNSCFKSVQNTQFIEIPEIIQLTSTQIELLKDDKYFGDIMFKKFEVTNHLKKIFKFYIKIHRKRDLKFHIFLYLTAKPERYKRVDIMWDFVCRELEYQHISKFVQLQRDKCDDIEGFDCSLIQTIQSQLTFIVNIRILS